MKLLHNATICNEGLQQRGYILIEGELIARIGKGDVPTSIMDSVTQEWDLNGALVMPGVIDDQVHFREPGLTHKGDLQSESRAAVAGGVTSYMDMPNVNPATTTIELLEQKFSRAAEVSYANYSFYLGATNNNIEQIRKVNPREVCGVKVFMGSSTGNMLVDDEQALEQIFRDSPTLIATHCEDEAIIRTNLALAKAKYGDSIPLEMHPLIRSVEACYRSTSRAVELAKKYDARLHVLHLSSARELDLFDERPLEQKLITNEVCVHHLWFTDADYSTKGNRIKWNPAIKSRGDRDALREAVRSGRIDVVATDHAPHTTKEKQGSYMNTPSGAPFVQHSLPVMLEMVHQGVFTVERVVEMMCHHPATLFQIEKRGFLREGYFADIAVVELNSPWQVGQENILYKCCWSPIEGETLRSKVMLTFVNGQVAYSQGLVKDTPLGKRLTFSR